MNTEKKAMFGTVALMLISMFVLFSFTIAQFLFPEFKTSFYEHLIDVECLFVLMIPITVGEHVLCKRGVSRKVQIVTTLLKLLFCVGFYWFMNSVGTYSRTDRMWLQLPFLLYLAVPLLTNLIIGIVELIKGRASAQRRIVILRLAWTGYAAILLCFAVLLPACALQPSWIKEKVHTIDPYELRSKDDYFTKISDLAVEGDSLYVLFENYGILEIYSLDGGFQNAIAVKSADRGHAALYIGDNSVWLESRNNWVYRIRDGRFEMKTVFSENNPKASLVNGKSKRTASDGTVFLTDGVSVFRETAEGEKTVVVKRPFWYVFSMERLLLVLLAAAILIPALVCLWRKKKGCFSTKNPLFQQEQ